MPSCIVTLPFHRCCQPYQGANCVCDPFCPRSMSAGSALLTLPSPRSFRSCLAGPAVFCNKVAPLNGNKVNAQVHVPVRNDVLKSKHKINYLLAVFPYLFRNAPRTKVSPPGRPLEQGSDVSKVFGLGKKKEKLCENIP